METVQEDREVLSRDSDLDVAAERMVVLDIDDQVPSGESAGIRIST